MPPLTAPHSDNLLLGKGEVLFNRKNADGTFDGYRHMGNVETLELTTTDDVLDKYSSMTRSASLYKRVTRRRDVVIRIVADEFTPENLALALMGDRAATPAQAGAAVVGEVLSEDPQYGGFYKTAMLGPITGVVVDQGATELVLGTDYTIHNASVGVIRILPDSPNIAIGGDPLTIDYTPTAYPDGLTTVRGGTETLVEGSLLFVPDPTSGPQILLEVWLVSVSPEGALGLLSQEFAQMTLTMAVQADEAGHPTEPLYRATYLE